MRHWAAQGLSRVRDILDGSATALPWRDQYLALFHTVSVGAGASGAYTSFAYTFSAEPPFAITGVSRALPLVRAAARIPNSPTQP